MSRTVLHNGTLLTQDPARPRAEAIAVSNGRIEAVGSWNEIEPLAGAGSKLVDLEGGTLLPGFNDAHVHVWKVGQMLTSILDLRDVASLDELARRVAARDRELPEGAWLLGRGYNEARMAEGRQPTRRDLDAVAPGRPVALTRTCGHMMVVNTRALELARVDASSPTPGGGAIVRDASGEPTGLLQETAMGLAKAVIPDPSVDEYAEMIRAAQRAQLGKGITSATEAGAYTDLVRAYRQLDREERLEARANVLAIRLSDEKVDPLPLPERFVSDTLRIDSVKIFADGGLSGATAALVAPLPARGHPRPSPRSTRTASSTSPGPPSEAGLRVCTHAIGDAAIRECPRRPTSGSAAAGIASSTSGYPDAAALRSARRAAGGGGRAADRLHP